MTSIIIQKTQNMVEYFIVDVIRESSSYEESLSYCFN